MDERKVSDGQPDAGVVFAGQPRAVDVDIVVPVYNEQAELGSSVLMLVEQVRALAAREDSVVAQVVIADNASGDRTWDLARRLVESFPDEVRAVRIPQKGRGRALKLAWGSSRARARAYMDVDLSTDVAQVGELVDPILQGRADISFGSRLLPDSKVRRCAKREFISRSYNRMLQGYLGAGFRDAQCGFKAIGARVARDLLPQVEDDEWFFDTELLVLGERAGLSLHEFPVRWTEDAGSTVKIVDTVRKDLAGMRRLKRARHGEATAGSGSADLAEKVVGGGVRALAPDAGAGAAASGAPSVAGAAAAHEEGLRVPKRGKLDWAAFIALMAASFAVFFWNLTASGYANEFYSAAAQAGSQDWEAFFWGSLDAGNAITVDKPPASIWLMALSVRLLGLSSFAILLPQALMGVATTWLLHATVRRYWGNWAGVAAGAVFVTTPVAALMFRFNNPDALLVFLLVAASAAVLRALEKPASREGGRRRTAWLALAGLLVGLAFLTKQLQAFLVLPGFALAMLAFSPARISRRLADAAVALGAMIVGAGWWVLAGVLVPSGSRPYFGGSQTDSFLELTFSYNGFGRLTGDETGSVVAGGGAAPGGAGSGMWGETGLLRLLGSGFADQISWFALLAVVGILLGIVCARLFPKGDVRRRTRGAFLAVFGAWLSVTWVVFSMMAGIFHQYYTVALAPAIAVLAAVCARGAWELRERMWTQVLVFSAAAASVVWAFALVRANGSFDALAWGILVCGLGACAAAFACRIVAWRRARSSRDGRGAHGLHGAHGLRNPDLVRGTGAGRPSRRRALRTCFAAACALAALAVFAGPVAWTWATVSTGHTGSIVSAGPASAMGAGAPGGGGQTGAPDTGGDGQGGGDGGDRGGDGAQPSDDGRTAQAQPDDGQAQDSGSTQDPAVQAPGGQTGGTQQQDAAAGGQQQGAAAGARQPPASGGDDAAGRQASPGAYAGLPDGDGQGPGAGQGSGGAGGELAQDGGAPNAPGASDAPGAPGGQGGQTGQGGQGGAGAGIFGGQTSSELVELMEENASGYRWAAATTGSQNAAGYQLESGLAVMAIGGFNGSDPAPTLEQFKSYVEQGLVRYYIASGGMDGQQMGGSDAASQIEEWVSANFTAQSVGSATVYDLASANS